MSSLLQVKNKMPAARQITAEQLIREAKERELELAQPVEYKNCCFNDTFHTVHTFISYKLMSHSFMLLCCVLATDHDGAHLSVIDKISVRRELA